MTEQVADLLLKLCEIYTPDEARLWMESPNKLLGGATAIDLIRRGDIDKVEAVVDALLTGSYL